MNPIDATAADISARATPADVNAARAFLSAFIQSTRQGSNAALNSPGALHLVRTYRLRRHLDAVARRIVADHPRPHDVRHAQERDRLITQWRRHKMMTSTELKERLARVQEQWDKEEAEWVRANATAPFVEPWPASQPLGGG